MPYEVVRRSGREYGQRLGQMFDAIDPNPLGSASLAQVHRARLVTGEDVAVARSAPARSRSWRRTSTSFARWCASFQSSSTPTSLWTCTAWSKSCGPVSRGDLWLRPKPQRFL
ncbi:MAG: AarF/UbiB family protein [Collinsella sp.]